MLVSSLDADLYCLMVWNGKRSETQHLLLTEPRFSHQFCIQAAPVWENPASSAVPDAVASLALPAGRPWSLPPTDAPSAVSYAHITHWNLHVWDQYISISNEISRLSCDHHNAHILVSQLQNSLLLSAKQTSVNSALSHTYLQEVDK